MRVSQPHRQPRRGEDDGPAERAQTRSPRG